MKNIKFEKYSTLLSEFKNHSFPKGLLNPHSIEGLHFNYQVINPWEIWHGNLDAEILLLGQDFSDKFYFEENLKTNWLKEQESPTNTKLCKLFSQLGYNIGLPDASLKPSSTLPLFFTNAVLGIKDSHKKRMNLPIKTSWYIESAYFIKELIHIIQPRHIIAMGMIAHKSINYIYGQKSCTNIAEAIDKNGTCFLNNSISFFTVAHCSPLGRRNRNFELQLNDWLKIKNSIAEM